MIFPLISTEWQWSKPLRAVLYGVGLIYFFMGVAIVSDIFMGAIEKVTGKRVQTRDRATGRYRTGMLWNETVATLTLMALGSSAPEIFLSIIDVVKKKFYFGDLGPSTIVGSASFNLFVIVGTCVMVIPSGEVRQIMNRPAFYITAIFSIFAYIWMAGVVTQISPGIIEPWEAICTLLMLPVLIWVSYKFDRGDAEFIVAKFRIDQNEVELPEVAPSSSISIEEDFSPFVKFDTERLLLRGPTEDKLIEINVRRVADVSEYPLTVGYRTEGISAVPGYDYEDVEGRLEFLPGEMVKTIQLEIMAKPEWRREASLLLILEDPDEGLMIDPETDGGEDETYLTVCIDMLPTASRRATWTIVDHWLGLYHMRKGMCDWKEQVTGILYVGGSSEEQADATKGDWAMHLICLPWKLLFCGFPPTTFFGGWFAFFISLLGIALVTACISDLAELFGCCIALPDIVTAFTFVALGTSMPDLFASLTAAKEDPTADASIVNVTGSNSVNVYLGLGVPWTVASLYWTLNGRTPEWEAKYPEMAAKLKGAAFVVEARNLGFCVLTFIVVCAVALVMLHFRRKWLGGELGGSFASKINTFMCFILMWLGWVGLSSWRILRFREDWGMEPFIVQGLCVFCLVVGVSLSTLHMKMVSVRFIREQTALAEAQAAARTSLRFNNSSGDGLSKDSAQDRDSRRSSEARESRSKDSKGEEEVKTSVV